MLSYDQIYPLLRVPYKKDGRTPEEGMDCYGVVRWILLLEGATPEEVPDVPTEIARVFQYRKSGRLIWPPLPRLRALDVLFFNGSLKGGLIDHIGIVIDDGVEFVHSSEQTQSPVIEPVRKHIGRVKAVGRFDRFA